MQKFHSHGKLLLSGEYVVLDGATALALPTKFGQSLEVSEIQAPEIRWKSFDESGTEWFQHTFSLKNILENKSNDDFLKSQEKVSKMLFLTVQSAADLNPEVLKSGKGFEVTTKTDFPIKWGLGTSSTLVANVAKWFSIDAYELLERTFGGSGYDIAVAQYEQPVTYQLQGDQRSTLVTSFDPEFRDHLFFIYLNKKQNSRQSIAHYKRQNKEALSSAIEKITTLTHQMITSTNLAEFNLLLEIHENIISQLVELPKVKTRLFPDYPGAVKSLGGWGGDFVLATGDKADMEYFRRKGYLTIVPYSEMILS